MGVKIRGQGLGRGQGLKVKVGVKVVVKVGVKVGGQGPGSRYGEVSRSGRQGWGQSCGQGWRSRFGS